MTAFGFDPRIPVAPTGEFPGFVNPTDSRETDQLVIVGNETDREPIRRPGRRK
jgi:hypothetical protein